MSPFEFDDFISKIGCLNNFSSLVSIVPNLLFLINIISVTVK